MRTSRKIAIGSIAAVAALGSATLVAAAPEGAPLPDVVASALPGSVVVIQQCDGEVIVNQSQALLKVERPNATSGTISVDVSYSGSLVGTPDLGPLPDPVVIEAGESSTIVPVEADAPGDVTLTIEPGDGYAVGDPASATADVVAEGSDLGCQDPTVETIQLGAQPTPYPVYDRYGFGVGDSTLVIQGELPPGLGFDIDGTWSGAATTLGTFEFTACYQLADFCGLQLPFRITVVDAGPIPPVIVPGPAPATPVPGTPDFTG
ncbi:MAG: hypothetical protein R2702_06225 [Acidimicrobiales bacterium]